MSKNNSGVWTIYTDGSSCNATERSGIGVVIFAPDATEAAETVSARIPFRTSHAAEYTAVIRGLQTAHKRGAQTVELRSDLQTMVAQLRGETPVKSAHLKPLHARAVERMALFASVSVVYVERALNAQADKLAKEGMKKGTPAPSTPVVDAVVAPVTAKPVAPAPVTPTPVKKVVAAPTPVVAKPVAAPEPTPTQFYKPVGNELWLWNTERLWQIAAKLPVQTVPVADLSAHLDAAGWFGDEPLTLRRVAHIARAVREADTDKPLLLCGDELIDGRFRLAKAVSDGKAEIAAKRLSHLPAPCARYPLRYAP